MDFNPEELDDMKRKQIQALCKAVGIRANQKTVVMVRLLKEWHAENHGTGNAEGDAAAQDTEEDDVAAMEVERDVEVEKEEVTETTAEGSVTMEVDAAAPAPSGTQADKADKADTGETQRGPAAASLKPARTTTSKPRQRPNTNANPNTKKSGMRQPVAKSPRQRKAQPKSRKAMPAKRARRPNISNPKRQPISFRNPTEYNAALARSTTTKPGHKNTDKENAHANKVQPRRAFTKARGPANTNKKTAHRPSVRSGKATMVSEFRRKMRLKKKQASARKRRAQQSRIRAAALAQEAS